MSTAALLPGVDLKQEGGSPLSAHQQAQLQAALALDVQLRRKLEDAARTGQLSRITALDIRAEDLPLGQFDPAEARLRLPALLFDSPTGLRGVLRVQSAVIRFSASRYAARSKADGGDVSLPVSIEMVTNLQQALNGSAALVRLTIDAATTSASNARRAPMLLEAFGTTHPGRRSGGSYFTSSRSVNLPAIKLHGISHIDDNIFVLGHEVQHALNSPATTKAFQQFMKQIETTSRSPTEVHDYTEAIRSYLASKRFDESSAQISGWNAFVSRQSNRTPSEIYTDLSIGRVRAAERMLDFVEVSGEAELATPRPNLKFNPDNTLSMSPENVAAMGRNYFDRPGLGSGVKDEDRPVQIGESGQSDYANYYGTFAIEKIVTAEREHAQRHPQAEHRLTLDMARLGLDERMMEMEGIDLSINPATPQPYYDSSQTPPRRGLFHHTQDDSVAPEFDHDHVPTTGQADMRQSGHPAHARYTAALEVIHQMESRHGIERGAHSEKLAAALLVEAERVGHTLMNATLAADGSVHGVLEHGARRDPQCRVATDHALSLSVEAHTAQWCAVVDGRGTGAMQRNRDDPVPALSIQQWAPLDREMFDRIRSDTPAVFPDSTVAAAMLAAKQNGIPDAAHIAGIHLDENRLMVQGTTPGFRAMVDMGQPLPLGQDTSDQLKALHQQSMQDQQEEMQRHAQAAVARQR